MSHRLPTSLTSVLAPLPRLAPAAQRYL